MIFQSVWGAHLAEALDMASRKLHCGDSELLPEPHFGLLIGALPTLGVCKLLFRAERHAFPRALIAFPQGVI